MEKTKDITNNIVTEYINSFYKPLTAELGDMRQKAEESGVPIILRETEIFLSMFIDIVRPERVLEIGTAIGYSSMFFAQKMLAQSVSAPEVFTIEKDEKMFDSAAKNMSDSGYDNIIRLIQGDGEEGLASIKVDDSFKPFDMLFIDAAKSHYIRFLNAALPLMKSGASIIADNTLFQAKVASDEYDKSGRHRTNIRKLREFNAYCMNEKSFSTSIAAIGDGLTIIKLL